MKPLQDYIKDLKYIKLPASTGYRTFDEFLDVNNISENEINEHIINTYIKTTKSKIFRYDVNEIYETLSKSHDHNKLISKMKKIYGDIFYDFNVYDSDSNVKSFFFSVLKKNFKNTVETEKFNNLCMFFNYTISEVKEYEKHEIVVYMEPNYTEKITDFVYNECNKKLYHITKKSNVKRILYRGLQLKEGEDYRDFLPRIYVSFGETPEIIKNNINHTLDQLNYKTNYEILEIDLSKYSIDIYKDTSSDNKYDGYIYAYIPPKFIKIINEDEQ